MSRIRPWAVVLLLNATLAAAIQALPASEPTRTDRLRYEYVGSHPLQPGCDPLDIIYCYRFLVPALLERVPIEPTLRWRLYRGAATAAAGTIVAIATGAITGAWHTPFAVTILTQGSYGFAFTAYDPYTADPFVFVCIAFLAWCWLYDRWRLALATGVLGLFAKETVVLMGAATALAALLPPRRPTWRLWVAQGVALALLLVTYRWALDTYLGWGLTATQGATQNALTNGGWLSLWLEGNPPLTRIYLVFVTFAFGWLFALAGIPDSPPDLRRLALGTVVPFAALNYVQNPERAIGNVFFIILPLAGVALARVPAGLAITATALSTAISTRAATSSDWLPPTKYTLIVGAIAAGAVLRAYWHQRRVAIAVHPPADTPLPSNGARIN